MRRSGCAGPAPRGVPARPRGRAAGAGPGGTRRPPTTRARCRTPRSRSRSRGRSSRCRGRRAGDPARAGPAARPVARRSTGRATDGRSMRTNRPVAAPDDLAVEGGRQAIGEFRGTERPMGQGTVRPALVRLCGPESSQAPREVRSAGLVPVDLGGIERHAGTSGAPAPSSARRRSARAFASTPGSRRGPVQAGQPPSHPHAAIRLRGARR